MPKALKKISIIWVLIAVFILKEALWVAVIPPREAPDELGHYGYVESLFYESTFPLLGLTTFSQRVQVAGTPAEAICDLNVYIPGNQFNWITQHPPFYYLLLLPLFAVLPHSDVLYSIFILRFFSILLGAITLYFSWKTLEKVNPPGTYRVAGETKETIIPSETIVNAAIVGAIAFLPMFSYISAVVNNDNLVGALSAILIYMLVGNCDDVCEGGVISLRKDKSSDSGSDCVLYSCETGADPAIGHRPPPIQSFKNSFYIGLVLGILVLTKATALPLIGVVFVVYLIRFFTARNRDKKLAPPGKPFLSGKKQAAVDALIVFGTVLIFAGWWYARNYYYFGVLIPELKNAISVNPSLLAQNPTLVALFPELGGAAKTTIGFWDFLFTKGFIVEYFKNIWGAFGRFFTQLSQWQYYAISVFTLIGLFGCVVSIYKNAMTWVLRGRANASTKKSLAIRKTVIGLVLVVYLFAITWEIYQITVERGYLSAMQGRYFLPALLPFFYFFVRGWEQVVPKKVQPVVFALMLCFFIANDISALLYVVIPALY